MRLKQDTASISRIANSMLNNGQLVPIKVRPISDEEGKYEIIFGHRRVHAARVLGWKTIEAELANPGDLESLQQALVENFEREELSDYNKGLIFEKLSVEFGLTYEQIDDMLGMSRQHITGFISMVRLFDTEDFKIHPELNSAIHKISEHHARILNRIEDKVTRINLALLIVKDGLSVRDLNNIVLRLRSWMKVEKSSSLCEKEKRLAQQTSTEDMMCIKKLVMDEFRLPRVGDFESFREMHTFDDDFTIFSSFPATGLFEKRQAFRQEEEWFYKIMPNLSFQIENLKITVIDTAALASFKVVFSNEKEHRGKMGLRGTLALRRTRKSWKIFHEHWSRSEELANPTESHAIHIYRSAMAVSSPQIRESTMKV